MNLQYRHDIDGLRAIAVLGVLIFHLDFGIFPGGFVGVDIFFVISGFLITQIILSDLTAQRFSLVQFYKKRILRLFPALFVMLTTVFIIAYFLFMPDQFVELGQSLVSVASYTSNVYFYLKTDYFTGPSELIPLLHTWSLAVEEQFYLIFPIIVMLALKKGIKVLVGTIAVLFLLSFVANVVYVHSVPSAVFYISIFRFWELLAGALVALMMLHKHAFNAMCKLWLGILGLGLIFVCFVFYSKQTKFPGIAALLPVLATLMLLLSAPSNDGKSFTLHSFLSCAPMRFIGKISYSLYLWHWPIIVFYTYWVIRDLYLSEKFALFIISFCLATLSYRYVEQPFRRRKVWTAPHIFYTSALLSAVFIVLGLSIHFSKGFPKRVDYHPQARVNKANSCFLRTSQSFHDWQLDACTLRNNNSGQYTLLWGDSHANHLINGFKHLASTDAENYIFYSSAGCVPIFDIHFDSRPNCRANNHYVRDLLLSLNINKVIIAGNWDNAISKRDLDIDSLTLTLDELRGQNIEVTVFSQVPIHAIKAPQYLAYRLSKGDKPIKDYRLKPVSDKNVDANIRALSEDVFVFNPADVLCEQNQCLVYQNGELLIEDSAHLSEKGSHLVVKSFLSLKN